MKATLMSTPEHEETQHPNPARSIPSSRNFMSRRIPIS